MVHGQEEKLRSIQRHREYFRHDSYEKTEFLKAPYKKREYIDKVHLQLHHNDKGY